MYMKIAIKFKQTSVPMVVSCRNAQRDWRWVWAVCTQPASKICRVNNTASENSTAEGPVFTYVSQQKVTLELLEDCAGNGGYIWYSWPFIQLEQAEFTFSSSMKKRFAKKLILWVCTWHLKSVWAHVGVILTSALLGKLHRDRACLLLLYLSNLSIALSLVYSKRLLDVSSKNKQMLKGMNVQLLRSMHFLLTIYTTVMVLIYCLKG